MKKKSSRNFTSFDLWRLCRFGRTNLEILSSSISASFPANCCWSSSIVLDWEATSNKIMQQNYYAIFDVHNYQYFRDFSNLPILCWNFSSICCCSSSNSRTWASLSTSSFNKFCDMANSLSGKLRNMAWIASIVEL